MNVREMGINRYTVKMVNSFTPWFLQNLIWLPTQFFLRLFGHFRVYGKENLRGVKGAVIFASNHTSELDPILIPAALPWFSRFSPMFYVSREKNFYNTRRILKRLFYGGFFFELWGAYQTEAGLHNYDISLRNHLRILKNGHSISIFPEGDKSFDGKLHEFKGGAAFLSHKTGAPIVPVAVSGTFQTTLGDFFFFKKRITLVFGKPIYPDELFSGKTEIVPHDYKLAMDSVVMPRVAEMLKSVS